jgi:uncharacterized protein (DUF697 family)
LLTLALVIVRVFDITGEFFMASTKQKVQGIIHAASIACDEIEGDSAPTSESGSAAIAQIQTKMIMAIASEHGVELTDAAAANLLITLSSTMDNHPVLASRQLLVGWLPGIDSDTDESTAAALTEAIGWSANNYFEQAETK